VHLQRLPHHPIEDHVLAAGRELPHDTEHAMMTFRPMLTVLLAALTLAASLIASAGLAVAKPATTPDLAAIDSYVTARMRGLRIPSTALGIVQGDHIVHLKGFGVADPTGRLVTPATPFGPARSASR
jgi:CubicO group peptidase (beta-lactamase class C family)